MANANDLLAQAEKLGIKVDSSWNDAKLKSEIDTKVAELEAAKKDAKAAGSVTVKNTSKNPTWVTATKRCAVGETVAVDAIELKAHKASIDNAVKFGLLEVVE